MTVIELFLYANTTNIIRFERTQKINSYKLINKMSQLIFEDNRYLIL